MVTSEQRGYTLDTFVCMHVASLPQERLWKMTAARQVAYMAAAVARAKLTKQLDKITPKSAREAAKAAILPSFTSTLRSDTGLIACVGMCTVVTPFFGTPLITPVVTPVVTPFFGTP